jgi:lipoprotein-anchoring transpeptidase ErfK/SrfK
MVAKKKKNKKNHKLLIFLVVVISALALITFFSNNFLNKTSDLACGNTISCIKDLSGKYDKNTKGVFMGKTFDSAKYVTMDTTKDTQVLGQTSADKHIFVDLSTQRLYAYEANQLIYSFPVSTGKWSLTPTGDFRIWIKLRYTRMTGGNPAIGTFYDLPNVPYTMYFSNNEVSKAAGYSLHGAYWHNNFGHPMSHGCVNIGIEDAGKLYYWANPPTTGNTTYASVDNPGTLVTIYGVTPQEN